MDITEFKEKCEKGHCIRNTIKSKKCLTDEKRELCFSKYNRKLVRDSEKVKTKKPKTKKFKIDEQWEELLKLLWERDGQGDSYKKGQCSRANWQDYCRLWKCMTRDEKEYTLKNHVEDLWLNENLDGAHIVSRKDDPSLKYRLDNVFLLGRLWHSLLDQYKDPITRELITKEKRLEWMMRIKGS